MAIHNIVLGAAIGSAALIGSLVVWDSVRESLTDMALRRLGSIRFALATQDRLFQSSLGPRLSVVPPPEPMRFSTFRRFGDSEFTPFWPYSSALALPGIVSRQDGAARANRVTVLGVDATTWPHLAAWGGLSPAWRDSGLEPTWERGETALVNETLARQLAAREGDEIIVRVRKLPQI